MERSRFEDSKDHTEWLQKCYIATLHEPENFSKAKKMLILQGVEAMRVRYLGGNKVLVSENEGGNLDEWFKNRTDWLRNIFESINLWTPVNVSWSRWVWIRIYGVPLQF